MQKASTVVEAIAPKAETIVVTPKAEEKFESPKVNSSDILSRTSVKVEPVNTVPVEEGMAQVSLDDIKDPIAKAIIDKKIKDLESGYNKKYQTVSQLRK
jgi:hypothetical protein